ncbi:cystin-1 isoform X1 [Herpailurus yagouaroundi]|uniref:cystin-1 isoform X1 n=1 Tax=Herpailurus yagouaroundi TaxID=1608482 RepID=UPI001AD6B0BF|nr:cystin-1 isoform X1 [Puma yagouaroundi]
MDLRIIILNERSQKMGARSVIPCVLASKESTRICSDRKQINGCLETAGQRREGGTTEGMTAMMVSSKQSADDHPGSSSVYGPSRLALGRVTSSPAGGNDLGPFFGPPPDPALLASSPPV